MTILNYFFDKILAKYSLKRTKLHHFFKFSWGSMPPNPPSKATRCMALCAMPIPPLFQKNFEPPRNEILDTPLLRVPLESKTFSSLSARIWNALSLKLNCNVSISLFKRNLKLFLLHNELVINYSK